MYDLEKDHQIDVDKLKSLIRPDDPIKVFDIGIRATKELKVDPTTAEVKDPFVEPLDNKI